jgi:hypothetical protein
MHPLRRLHLPSPCPSKTSHLHVNSKLGSDR